MTRTTTTGRLVISGAFALTAALGTAGTAFAGGQHAAPAATATVQAGTHGEQTDGSDHGATGKPAKADPNPDKGKDCQLHGKNGGINEDHCGPTTPATPEPTTETPAPTTTQEPGQETKPVKPTKPAEPTTEPTKPAEPTTEPTKPAEESHDCGRCQTVTPPAPVLVPVCGADNDKVVLPEAEGVIWQRGEWRDGTLVVRAISADWYTFPNGDEVTFTLTDEGVACDTPTTPGEDCDHTCPTPGTTTPETTKPEVHEPVVTKPVVTTPSVVTPARPVVVVEHRPAVRTGRTAPAQVVPAAPAPATVVESGTPAAPVFNSGVEGDDHGRPGALGAGLAVLAAALMAPAARRRVHG
ncbi:hypothetical protein [Arsenicicoccus dermatophilus]|uniref:hypothetical protein n=1 Tax=Arsenicicoccus dermatophilus TaxID=1076331 RepID=UPI001F4CA47A|nr:hypothetical protein [Arsenicicoccus dermatophilus]MCH8614011.1 hypothetical protein [Arsenicicoccus dermatophilus]